MQYPIDTVLSRLTQRADRLRGRVPEARADAEAAHAYKLQSHGDVIAVAERRRDEMSRTLAGDVTWDEIYRAARDLADASRQATGAIGNGPDFSKADRYEADAREIDGLVELIRSTGAKTIPTGELEKLGALRWVR